MKGREELEAPFPESPAPEAVGRLLVMLGRRVGQDSIDRLWIFPPLVKGRREWGLVAVSCLTDDPSRRTLITARYTAELTGSGVHFEPTFISEGDAPPDRLPGVMDGVVRRSDLPLGTPLVVDIEGIPANFHALVEAWGQAQDREGASG